MLLTYLKKTKVDLDVQVEGGREYKALSHVYISGHNILGS